MKIAITSEGNQMDSKIDARFGRCAYFAIYNTDTKETEFLVNPAKDSSGGAGPEAVQFVAQTGVKKIFAGDFGTKIHSLLHSLSIEMINEKDKTISEIISTL
ncbi:MAG: NifB/NifX family molybdenum-iron cluster-binding protein [Paludibacter sp.]|nr:NifB/NifX family molybdenum-iron cluster-binding protein [Paludibacter sp.]